ncbi:ribosomal large subunit pseudouridine synthase B [Keratinibaculum paraultunense]|uniref:Pseudouridine synthase n=1 Tax=Keratinibaculum paraultunense TaxID=1278232 RepID=A0A4R3L1A4_9FIRM|nr:pseudouridine synthase [Keratinibaculum paraultunense]QQY80643.1 rRNA pseudouridine synthase [Keratinibaculum paraultunense]TCS91377.1 ribosomal large subunit pseudouridine synthase B [Keratinibaculum paraultunense]
MRLQKYMAKCGVASRRKSEEIILEGRVKVNGIIEKKLGTVIDPNKDVIEVDNKIINMEENKVYIMLNKPEGYVTTVKDKYSKKIVLDLIVGIDERIYPVGRLDSETTGLLLMTNDGDLTYKLTHPSYQVPKKYIALVEGIPNNKKLHKFRRGLKIDGRITAEAYIKILKEYKNTSLLEISIHEGRNRQIRKMCQHIGHPVIKLKRVAIGELELGKLEVGKWRYLTSKEVKYLKTL